MENNNQQEFCPNSNLVWAILSTIFCCLPLGIVAIIKSTSVERLWREGRHEEARRAANSAKNFSLWGAIIAFVIWLIYVIMVVVAGASMFAFA